MKQLIFMVAVTLVGTVGVFFVTPFCGVAAYYLFAVLRPQYLWQWSLPPDISWSQYVAIATILAAVAQTLGFFQAGPGDASEKRRRTFSAPHIAVLLFGAWISVTYFTALDRDVAYPWFVEYLKIFLMFAASTILIRTARQVWMLFVIAALSIGYIAYEVNFLYLFEGHYLGIYHSGYGGLDNNGAGLLLAMGVPLCAFVWEGGDRVWRWVFAGFIPVLIHGMLLTYSRGAMVALLLASPIFFLRSRHKGKLSLAGLGLILALPLVAGGEIRQRFLSVQSYETDGSAQSRFSSWQAGWDIAKDNPLFGIGIRNSSLFTLKYGADLEGRVIHSQYLQLAADSGLPGLGLYLMALVTVSRATGRSRRAAKSLATADQRKAYAVACGVDGALAVFCIGGLFLSLEVFELPYLLLLLGAQLGTVDTAMPLTARVPAPTLKSEQLSNTLLGVRTQRCQ